MKIWLMVNDYVISFFIFFLFGDFFLVMLMESVIKFFLKRFFFEIFYDVGVILYMLKSIFLR